MRHSYIKRGILRYGWWSRTNHWIVAICFVLLTLSGLALFYPAFFGLTALFGGPEPTRIVHPYIGVFMTLFFLIQAVRFFTSNLFRRHDVQWMKQMPDMLNNRDDRLPPVGKNNAGQKLVYWIFLLTVPVLLISGVVLWRPWIADDMPIWALRWAAMIHAFTAFIAIITPDGMPSSPGSVIVQRSSRAAGRSLGVLARVGTDDATNSFKAYDTGFVRAVGIESRGGFWRRDG